MVCRPYGAGWAISKGRDGYPPGGRSGGHPRARTLIGMDAVPYHRLARTAAHRWWRPWVALLTATVTWLVLTILVVAGMAVAEIIAGQEPTGDGSGLGDRVALAGGLASIAVLLPITLLVARWIQRRPAGTLHSVTGRVRWGLLGRFLLPALAVPVLVMGGGLLLLTVTGGDTGMAEVNWPGWASLMLSVAMLLVLVPVQAAAEEYAFRGLFLQALGSILRRPWIPITVQAVAFAALHGWGTPWGFADLVLFGLVAGYLTVRTGGLEAAVAVHVMNNLLAFVLLAATGDLNTPETAADMPWQMVAVDAPVLIAYAAVVLAIHRRRSRPAPAAPQPGERVLTTA